jgi:transcriptional regulator with XRE-family HTH domain
VVVDPNFGPTLRRLREARSLSLRRLGKLVNYTHTPLWELETGRSQPTPAIAERLDAALDAGGELSGMVTEDYGPLTPDDEDRLRYVARNPRRIDTATIDSLAAILAHERRLEDATGSAPLVVPVRAHLALVEGLVAGAADDEHWPILVDVAGQWAHFAGWLHATTGDHEQGRRWYVRAMEWATEGGNPDMVATALSMRGHLAWVRGQVRPMIELSKAAAWQPASLAVRSLAIQQEARGLALLGDGHATDARLDESEQLAVEAAAHPEDRPPWMYFYDPGFFALTRGLAQHYLGRHDRAVELLTDGLNRLPEEIRNSDWIGWYVCQLAEAHAAAGNPDCAVAAVEESRRIAEANDAARLSADVDRMAHQLGL